MQCRSEASGCKEARAEGRCAEERCHEFTQFVSSLVLFLFPSRTSPPQSKLVFLNDRNGD